LARSSCKWVVFVWKIDFFKLPETIKFFRKLSWKNQNILVKLPEKIEILRTFAWKNQIFGEIA